MARPTPLAWTAFAVMVAIGGANFVFVKISNEELAPFWGAFLRFFYASLILGLFVLTRRIPWPRGRELVGTVVYGVTSFGLSYALAYTVLREVSAGLVGILFALGPLVTMILAYLHGLEKLHRRAILGGVVALGGTALLIRQQLTLDVAPLYLVLSLVGLFVMAESTVLVKFFPRPHPAAMNAVGMGIGAAFLLGLSWLAQEPWVAPGSLRNLAAVTYLSLLGSIGLFGLFLYAIARMDVSILSYQFVLMPIVTVLLANLLIGEGISWTLVLGGLIACSGVLIAITGASPPASSQPKLVAPVTVDAAPQSAASTSGAPKP